MLDPRVVAKLIDTTSTDTNCKACQERALAGILTHTNFVTKRRVMALTGEAKRIYQRDYMRIYMQARRAVKTPVKTPVAVLRPVKTSNKADLMTKPGLTIASTHSSQAPQSIRNPIEPGSYTRLPLYNKRIHKPGDKVRMTGPTGKLIDVTVPDLDADGGVLPDGW